MDNLLATSIEIIHRRSILGEAPTIFCLDQNHFILALCYIRCRIAMDSIPTFSAPSTPPRKPRRALQLMQGALGPHFATPLYRNNTRTGKTRSTVIIPGKAAHAQRLRDRIQTLMQQTIPGTSSDAIPPVHEDMPGDVWEDIEDCDMNTMGAPPESTDVTTLDTGFMSGDEHHVENIGAPQGTVTLSGNLKRNRQNDVTRLNDSWKTLFPMLRNPLLAFTNHSSGRYSPTVDAAWQTSCTDTCVTHETRILCLDWDREFFHGTWHRTHWQCSVDYQGVDVLCCAAHPVTHGLVLNGFFPTSPVKPRMAVSIHLLDFYFALLERSGDAVTAMSAALRTFYSRRGFPIIDNSVNLPIICLSNVMSHSFISGKCTGGAISTWPRQCHPVV
jgi:hypothetical protein